MKKTWLILSIIMAGCGPATEITSSWKNPDSYQQKVEPILVVGVMKEADTSLCRTMEERFVIFVNNLGYNAVSSMSVYGSNAFDRFNEEEPLKDLYTTRFKTVITIELLGRETEAFPPPVWLDNNAEWNKHPFPGQQPVAINNFIIQTRYIWQSNYYDLNGVLLLYSVNSKSYESSSNKRLANEYGKVVINDMLKSGFLKKQVIPLKAF